MIGRLRGTVGDRGPDWLLVDVGGVGFLAHCPSGTIAAVKQGADVTLHTHLVVREDSMTLYGFISAHEQRLFQVLTGVSGVGPKVGLALLSVMDADELSYAIASGNAASLARAQGVGQKLANRIVLELREKFTTDGPAAVPGVESEDVVAALMSLGYSQAEAADAASRADMPPGAELEERVRLALSHFAKARLD
ncbi:MAG: Holliday junction branch migration protein RuvA [Dehalococcoidia bacterium]